MTDITEEDIYHFTHGACWLLAEVLEAKTGYPRKYVYDQYGAPMHVVVQSRPGEYLDVEGTHTRDQLIKKYQHPDFGRYAQRVGKPGGGFWELPYYWDVDEEYLAYRAEMITPDVLALAA